MLPIDPGHGHGGVTPAPSEVPPSAGAPARAASAQAGTAQAGTARTGTAQTLSAQAMPHGGTIIRPGAVAWGGSRDAQEGGYSCEAIERALADVTRDAGRFPGLLAELAAARLWVPLPVRRRPFTDGAAVRLPLVTAAGTDFVPCFTSVQRLTGWSEADRSESAGAGATRAGDARVVPHIVVPAAGLAQRLPSGVGLAINPGSAPSIPLYPECVPYLARLAILATLATLARREARGKAVSVPPQDRPRKDRRPADSVSLGPPPAEPSTLLDQVRHALRGVPTAVEASRAWLSVPGHGEGLVIAVTLDDPASEPARRNVLAALERALAAIPLHVPFPVDVTFPGEPVPRQPGPDVIAEWMTRNTRPFYTRDTAS